MINKLYLEGFKAFFGEAEIEKLAADSEVDVVVAGIVGDSVVEEGHLAAGAAKLLEDQGLIGILARKAVRAEHGDDIDLGVTDGVAKSIKPGPVEPGTAVALVAEGMFGPQFMTGFLCPGPQGRDLAVDGLLALLPLGGDPGVDGGAHGSTPSVCWSSARWQRRR